MRSIFYVMIAAMLSVLLFGCNGDDGASSTTDPAAAAARVEQADNILYPRLALLINSGGTDSSSFNLASANSLYREALALDPANTEAHFGVAVTGIITLLGNPAFHKISATAADLIPVPSSGLKRRGISAGPARSLLQFGNDTRDRIRGLARSALTTDYRAIPPAKFLSGTNELPPSYYQDLIAANILPVLSDAALHLVQVTLDPNFAFYITPEQLGGNITDSIRVDLTEVYVILSVVQSLIADGSIAVAYNIDYDPQSESAVMAAWDVNSPFLSFRSGGAQRMKTARANYVGMTNSIQNGILYLQSETPHPGIDPIPYNPADDPVLFQLYAVMDTLEMVLSGPVQITGDFNNDQSEDVLTMNLYNFFQNAVPNYKMKMPGYTVGTQPGNNGHYDAVLTWTASSYNTWIFPDPTFNGLFPDMTDPLLKVMLGMDPSGWTQSILIEG